MICKTVKVSEKTWDEVIAEVVSHRKEGYAIAWDFNGTEESKAMTILCLVTGINRAIDAIGAGSKSK